MDVRLQQLAELGQSIWYDNIRRAMIAHGQLAALLDAGVLGVTSNPSIFEKAIVGSADYDESIRKLVAQGSDTEAIYEALVLEDIALAADLLQPVYEKTHGRDGYVSLEVRPTLAEDTDATIAEARRLFATLGRPNVMIKVPATPAGIPAIEALIAEGINVNVTLIFSLAQYEVVAAAYLAGLEKRTSTGSDLSGLASVASFFISRVDSAVDREFQARIDARAKQSPISDLQSLMGKTAIANARVAYGRFQELFSGERWKTLAAQGAHVQRPLWASTSTKNPAYPDTLYIDSLIGPNTVNTVPPATLGAFRHHGVAADTLSGTASAGNAELDRLAEAGIDLDEISDELQREGVAAFAKSYQTLLASLDTKRQQLQTNVHRLSFNVGSYQSAVEHARADLKQNRILAAIWNHNHTIWKPAPDEITNRLGWLNSPVNMLDSLHRIEALVESVRADGYTQALLLGMGGSSLAPEVFRKTFGVRVGYLDLSILDSTAPDAVRARAAQLDLEKTLFIVSTKSGGTVETLSFFKHFYNRVVGKVGTEQAGAHFIAITDPGSKLEKLASEHNFRTTFLNDPNIGGRYSALSYFGIVPAALVGVDVEKLLDRAMNERCNCDGCNCPRDGDNRAGMLGAILGGLAQLGRDKVTFVTSPEIESFGDWVEQLIAESTGKEGRGILPVVGEPLGAPDVYGDDRMFVYLKLANDAAYENAVQKLQESGHPVVRLHLEDIYDLGAQFFLWEMATAVAGYFLQINPFDQPNVESAKVLAREMVAAFTESGVLPAGETVPLTQEAARAFLSQAKPGDYIAIQAYVQPTVAVDAALRAIRTHLRDQLKLATTVGYGPRFLHSTGQLHKGDNGNGMFIQLISDAEEDIPIPAAVGADAKSNISFGVLKQAQALGDAQALRAAGRRMIQFNLGDDILAGLQALTAN